MFYIPSQSRLKVGTPIAAGTVARCKYINRRGKTEGYYTGYTFANQVGMTLQVPVVIEIVSNEASATVRDIKIKEQRIRLRKPKTVVNDDNAKVLQFLDLLCEIDRLSDESEEIVSKKLKDIIVKQNIRKEDMRGYCGLRCDYAASEIYGLH